MEHQTLWSFIGLWLLVNCGVNCHLIKNLHSIDDSFNKDVQDEINYVSCGEEITLNNTYFVNPDYPSVTNTGTNCRVTFGNITEGTCQLRIELPSFVLVPPNDVGNCVTDKFTVQGSTYPIPSICGYNSDQHMYIDFDPENALPSFIVSMDAAVTEDRIFSIKIIQIPCDATYKAPSGCLQYFTSPSGTVQTFGYPFDSQTTFQEAVTRQLSNQQYSICIRPERGYCSITWSSDPVNVPYQFLVSGEAQTLPVEVLGTPTASSYGERCSGDYIIIPEGSFTNSSGFPFSSERFCGAGFQNSVKSSFRPFQMFVKTDFSEITDSGNLGFSLNFNQNLC